MKQFTTLLLLLTLVLIYGCNNKNIVITYREDRQEQEQDQVFLPFDDGIFILTPLCFNEHYNNTRFRYGNRKSNFNDTEGSYYIADDFNSHITDFINVMNNLSPEFVDVVFSDVTDNVIPFDGLTHFNYLYSLQLSDYSLRMYVHRTKDFGYLYFLIFKWEFIATEEEDGYNHMIVKDNLRQHSLYRITIDELNKIIEIADGFEKREMLWTQ